MTNPVCTERDTQKVVRLHFKPDILEHLPRMPRTIKRPQIFPWLLYMPGCLQHMASRMMNVTRIQQSENGYLLRKVFQLLVNVCSLRQEFYRLDKLSSSRRLSEKRVLPLPPVPESILVHKGVITNPNRKHLTSKFPL